MKANLHVQPSSKLQPVPEVFPFLCSLFLSQQLLSSPATEMIKSTTVTKCSFLGNTWSTSTHSTVTKAQSRHQTFCVLNLRYVSFMKCLESELSLIYTINQNQRHEPITGDVPVPVLPLGELLLDRTVSNISFMYLSFCSHSSINL